MVWNEPGEHAVVAVPNVILSIRPPKEVPPPILPTSDIVV